MLVVESLHHLSVSVTELERAKRFYREVLGLREVERPAFDFPGAWPIDRPAR
jgi:glyoxylase I family protein